VPLDRCDHLGRAHICHGEHRVGGLALEADPSQHRAHLAADELARAAAELLGPGVRVLVDDVRHQRVVGRLHLALADIRADPHLAAGRQLALLLRRRQPFAAIEQREALALGHQHLDERLGRLEVELRPPLLLRVDHRQRADLLVANRDGGLFVVARRGARRGDGQDGDRQD
jgi:hypothetical protein